MSDTLNFTADSQYKNSLVKQVRNEAEIIILNVGLKIEDALNYAHEISPTSVYEENTVSGTVSQWVLRENIIKNPNTAYNVVLTTGNKATFLRPYGGGSTAGSQTSGAGNADNGSRLIGAYPSNIDAQGLGTVASFDKLEQAYETNLDVMSVYIGVYPSATNPFDWQEGAFSGNVTAFIDTMIKPLVARNKKVHIFVMPQGSISITGVLPEIISGTLDANITILAKALSPYVANITGIPIMHEFNLNNPTSSSYFYNFALNRTSNGATYTDKLANFKLAYNRLATIFKTELGQVLTEVCFAVEGYSSVESVAELGSKFNSQLPDRRLIYRISCTCHAFANNQDSGVFYEENLFSLTKAMRFYQSISKYWSGRFGLVEFGTETNGPDKGSVVRGYQAQNNLSELLPACDIIIDFLTDKSPADINGYIDPLKKDQISAYKKARSNFRSGVLTILPSKNLFTQATAVLAVPGYNQIEFTNNSLTDSTDRKTSNSTRFYRKVITASTQLSDPKIQGIVVQMPSAINKIVGKKNYTLCVPIRASLEPNFISENVLINIQTENLPGNYFVQLEGGYHPVNKEWGYYLLPFYVASPSANLVNVNVIISANQTATTYLLDIDVDNIKLYEGLHNPNFMLEDLPLIFTGVDSTVSRVGNQVTYNLAPKFTLKEVASSGLANTTFPVLSGFDGSYGSKLHYATGNVVATDGALTVPGGLPNPTTACYAPPAGYKWVARVSATMSVSKEWTGTPVQPYAFGAYTYIRVGASTGRTETKSNVPIQERGVFITSTYNDTFDLVQNAVNTMKFFVDLFVDANATPATFTTWADTFNIQNISYKVLYELVKI